MTLSKSLRKLFQISILLVLTVVLTGCKTELYSKVEEQQGNEMLALLLEHNISSEKKPGKDNMVSLHVDRDKLSYAVEILRKNGYPKSQFNSVKDLFKQDKLISTPFEDRTRYIYALSESIAETLSLVDGVMTARVHVVIPEEEEENRVSSAAVFIKHNPNYDFNAHIAQIKTIVSSGIAGLSYDAVDVSLFPAQTENIVQADTHHVRNIYGLEIVTESVPKFYALIVGLILLIILSVLGNIYFFLRRKELQPSSSGGTQR